MIYKLTATEIAKLIAKHASKDFPALRVLDGKTGDISLKAVGNKFWAEIEVKEKK